MGILVPAIGPQPCELMIVGEKPGHDEANWYVGNEHRPTPFVGPSGKVQDRYLQRNGMHRSRIRITNLVEEYTGGDNPTPEEVQAHTPRMLSEIRATRPRFILSVGAHSTRWFLGNVDMESVHGLPQRSLRPEIAQSIIIPIHHPAYGLRDPEAAPLVYWDYEQAGRIVRGEVSQIPIADVTPAHYIDGGVCEAREVIRVATESGIIAEDTEGLKGSEWGFSVSAEEGVGYVFRRAHPEFADVARLYRAAREAGQFVSIFHNAMWDLAIERALGLGSPIRLFDTMVAAFFLRIEPQGLKSLARRHAGMEMRTYEETIGEAALEKQIAYLFAALDLDWAYRKNDPRLVQENDGTARLYTPQPIGKRIESILADHYEGKLDKEGNPVDVAARWHAIDSELRRRCRESLGGSEFPTATLDDIPLERAIRYAGRDPDATLRVYHRIHPLIGVAGLTDRLQLDLDILSVFEEMQATGIMASRKYFESLSAEMWDRMMEIGQRLSVKYNEGRPFNPMSSPQVGELVKRLGMKGAKKTKTGAVSTSKKSMEHLRKQHEAMDWVFTWREHEKVKDSFADPIVERMPSGGDYHPVRCNIKITRVATDRISASDPNLTAMPVGSELGLRVRGGFKLPDDSPDVFVTGDMSQIEMRVFAHLSRDDRMCDIFREGRDIHLETAAHVFSRRLQWDPSTRTYPVNEVHKMLHRLPTKRTGFGVITGIQGPGLYDQLRMQGVDIEKFCETMGEQDPVEACNALIKAWFARFPRGKGFLVDCGNRAYNHGYVRELGGFIRYLPTVWSSEEYISAEARRQSHSHIISGTAQWMLRLAMRWLKPQIDALRTSSGLNVKWVMQIHDEVLFQCHADIAPTVASLLKEALISHSYPLIVPVDASTAIAKSWGSLEK